MARTTNPPVPATRRNTAKTRLHSQGNGALDEQDQRSEGLTAVQDEQDDDRERDERPDRGEYTEQGSRREQRPAMSGGMDTFAPVLEAWKQVFKSWSELTETMVKVQQDAFASMISGASAPAKNVNLGANGNGERAFSGLRSTASTPERIEHDRR